MNIFDKNDKLMKDIKLYHYTSGDALLEIIKTRKLWASHISFLNDSNEFKLAFEKIRCKSKMELHSNIAKLLDGDEEKEDVYVFSLTEKRDNLNMWIKYTDMSPGFCLEFDEEKLKIEFSKENMNLISVFYKEEEHNELLKEIRNEVKNEIDIDSDTDSDKYNYYSNLYEKMIKIAPFIKHNSFEDEEEWRIVIRTKRENVNIRKCGMVFKPYYELDISNVPLKEIIIGPNGNSEYIKSSVEFLCSKFNKNDLPNIKNSEIPYR